MIKIPVFIFIFISSLSSFVLADASFEFGETTLTNTVETGWTTINLTAGRYNNPIVIAGPLTHNNNLALSIRVRNVSATSFQIGMQSPCESEQRKAAGITCPPTSWSPETVPYLVIEQGLWVFPDGTKVEAKLYTTSTVRSSSSSSLDSLSFEHSFASAPAVLHTINTANINYPSGHSNAGETKWISSTVTGSSSSTAPSNSGFRIALEGAEVSSIHGSESIAWLAIEQGHGSNNGFNYDTGRTSGLYIDRHSDGCFSVGNFLAGAGFSSLPKVVMQHNSMQGGNGAWVRQCAIGTLSALNVHMEEDQVNDGERTGIPEYGAWFAFQSGGRGVLEAYNDLALEKTVATEPADIIEDNDASGNVTPGDRVRFEITVTNEGEAELTNIIITDPLSSSSYTYEGNIAGGDSQDDLNPYTTGLEWVINSLLQGSSEVLSFEVTINESIGSYVNTATGSSAENDSYLLNNSSAVTPDVLRIIKYVCNETTQGDGTCDVGSGGASDPADDFVFSVNGSPGDTLVYRIEYENFATQVDVFNFSDDVPSFTTLALDSFSGSGEVQVECHASASNTLETLDTGVINPVVADIISVCGDPILPNERGAVMFKATVN